MGRYNKIAQLGCAGRIEKILADGFVSAKEIARRLTEEGFAVSPATVTRHLRAQREERRDTTQKIVRDHVEKTVPADLDALEEMEEKCLDWTREPTDAFAHRLAGKYIADHLEGWLATINNIDPALYANEDDPETALKLARGEAVREIMADCLGWIADDLSLQKARLAAMRMAAQIIDLKLKHAIGDSGGSNIIIGAPEDAQPTQPDPQAAAAPRLLTFPSATGTEDGGQG